MQDRLRCFPLIATLLLITSYGCSAHSGPDGTQGTIFGLERSELPSIERVHPAEWTYVQLANQEGTVLNGAPIEAGKFYTNGWIDAAGNFIRDPKSSPSCVYIPQFHETDCLTGLRIQLELDRKTIDPKKSFFAVSNGQMDAQLWITGTYDAQASVQYQIRFPDQPARTWYLPMAWHEGE